MNISLGIPSGPEAFPRFSFLSACFSSSNDTGVTVLRMSSEFLIFSTVSVISCVHFAYSGLPSLAC